MLDIRVPCRGRAANLHACYILEPITVQMLRILGFKLSGTRIYWQTRFRLVPRSHMLRPTNLMNFTGLHIPRPVTSPPYPFYKPARTIQV